MQYDFDTNLLEQQAEAQSKKGMLAYTRWWFSSAITPPERDYLIQGGFQETFKGIAKDVDKKGE